MIWNFVFEELFQWYRKCKFDEKLNLLREENL